VTDRYDYDAFGNIISQAGSTPNVYLYSGEQNDPSLGLYYLRARYLNSNSGRFFTADTFPGDPESPLSLHKYLYASANPVNRRDPGGHLSLPELTAAVTIQGILAQIEITHVVFPSIVIGVALTIDRLGFEDLNEALQLASDASNSLIVLAADDLYSAGNQLIALGSRTILLAKDYTDIAKGVTGVLNATRAVADSINDVYAASGKVTLLLNDMYGLFRNFDKSARDTVTVLTNQTPVPTINNSIGATADATRAFFKVVLQIATSGNTSGLIIQP
jgi:RHS repeat-associated protein